MELARAAGWMPGPVTGSRVPAAMEYRYCPTDSGHWRVDGEKCHACGAVIGVIVYKPVAEEA